MKRETYRAIIVGVHVIIGILFIITVIRVLLYGACFIYPLFMLVIWMQTIVTTIKAFQRRR